MSDPLTANASLAADAPAAPGEGEEPASPRPGSGCEVDVELNVEDTDPPLHGWLGPLLERAAALAGAGAGRLGVSLVDDAAMTVLHETYRGEPGTTDVLTFDLSDGPADGLDGDIAVCVDEAARQAARREHDVRDEVLLYAVHGLMHLLGEDDHEADAFERMHRREDELLTRLGVGPRFWKRDDKR